MSKLITLNELNLDNFIDLLKDSEVMVYENVQGSKIFFTFNGNEFILKARNIDSNPINKVDLALQRYYKPVYDFLDALDERVKKLIPKGVYFCCQYFYDNQPSSVKYDSLPKNNLILTSIVKNNRFTFDIEEIMEYSELLGIEHQPIIFKGTLTTKQLELITYFLNTSPKDLEYVFGEDNFASFFYKILNPAITHSALMQDGTFQDKIEKLILRINNEDELCLAILNPLYAKSNDNTSEYVDSYSILIIDFLEHLHFINFDKIPLKSTDSDTLYIEIISFLFNSYCSSREEKVIHFDFDIPLFFYEEKFKLNMDLITNLKTKEFIEKDVKLEYLFKVVLNSFRYRKNKSIGLLNNEALNIFNGMVDTIDSLIDKKMKIERDINLANNKLLDFGKFYNIQYSKDAADQVYPELWKEFDTSVGIDTKKKKG